MSEGLSTFLTSPLPLSITLPDGASGLFPRALVYDSADSLVATQDLTEVGSTGRYTDSGFTPGVAGTFTAFYVVYTDAGHTTESNFYEHDQDMFSVKSAVSLYENGVWIDTVNGAAGTVLGVNGTSGNPVNTLADAVTLSATLGTRKYYIKKTSGGPLTLTSGHSSWEFIGIGSEVAMQTGGQDVDGSLFRNIDLGGVMNDPISAFNCLIDITGIDGYYENCRFRTGMIDVVDGAEIFLQHCSSGLAGAGQTPIFDFSAAHVTGIKFHCRGWDGGIEIQNMDNAADVVSIDINAGQAIFGATVSTGNLALRGVGVVIDALIGAVTYDRTGFIPNLDVTSVFDVRQGWAYQITSPPGTRLQGVVHLESNGARIALPGTARLAVVARDAAGVSLWSQSAIVPNSEGYFEVTEDPFTPANGTVIAIIATLTLTGQGSGTQVGQTEVAFADFA